MSSLSTIGVAVENLGYQMSFCSFPNVRPCAVLHDALHIRQVTDGGT